MRRILQSHQWITVVVSALLLFATSGMALSRMTCLISGYSEVRLGAPEDCCPEMPNDERASLRPLCCAIAEADGAQVIGVVAVELEWETLRASLAHAPSVACCHASEVFVAYAFESRPPPISVPARLALQGSFLI